MAQVLEGKAVVATVSKPCQIEIRDLDESITQEEVQEAMRKAASTSDKDCYKVLSL